MVDECARDEAGDYEASNYFAELSARLAAGIERALPGWVRRVVIARIEALRPGALGSGQLADLEKQLDAAQAAVLDQVLPPITALLALDVDDQRVNPMALVRAATPFATRVLRSAGVAPVARDPVAVRAFPDDDYDLTPASFADIDPDLHELGIMWGAAKAHLHMRTHGTDRFRR